MAFDTSVTVVRSILCFGYISEPFGNKGNPVNLKLHMTQQYPYAAICYVDLESYILPAGLCNTQGWRVMVPSQNHNKQTNKIKQTE